MKKQLILTGHPYMSYIMLRRTGCPRSRILDHALYNSHRFKSQFGGDEMDAHQQASHCAIIEFLKVQLKRRHPS